MAYLKKNQRYEEILNLAMQIAKEEGIAAITTRRIANIGNFAIGQIHHHFESMSQLKAVALKQISENLMVEIEQTYSNAPILEQLIYTVSPLEGKLGHIMRKLWNEAVFLAERDSYIKEAYKISLEEWHETIVNLIEQGKEQNVFITDTPTTKIAWELIALSCGIDTISIIESFKFEKDIIKEYIYQKLQIQS